MSDIDVTQDSKAFISRWVARAFGQVAYNRLGAKKGYVGSRGEADRHVVLSLLLSPYDIPSGFKLIDATAILVVGQVEIWLPVMISKGFQARLSLSSRSHEGLPESNVRKSGEVDLTAFPPELRGKARSNVKRGAVFLEGRQDITLLFRHVGKDVAKASDAAKMPDIAAVLLPSPESSTASVASRSSRQGSVILERPDHPPQPCFALLWIDHSKIVISGPTMQQGEAHESRMLRMLPKMWRSSTLLVPSEAKTDRSLQTTRKAAGEEDGICAFDNGVAVQLKKADFHGNDHQQRRGDLIGTITLHLWTKESIKGVSRPYTALHVPDVIFHFDLLEAGRDVGPGYAEPRTTAAIENLTSDLGRGLTVQSDEAPVGTIRSSKARQRDLKGESPCSIDPSQTSHRYGSPACSRADSHRGGQQMSGTANGDAKVTENVPPKSLKSMSATQEPAKKLIEGGSTIHPGEIGSASDPELSDGFDKFSNPPVGCEGTMRTTQDPGQQVAVKTSNNQNAPGYDHQSSSVQHLSNIAPSSSSKLASTESTFQSFPASPLALIPATSAEIEYLIDDETSLKTEIRAAISDSAVEGGTVRDSRESLPVANTLRQVPASRPLSLTEADIWSAHRGLEPIKRQARDLDLQKLLLEEKLRERLAAAIEQERQDWLQQVQEKQQEVDRLKRLLEEGTENGV
ncbi:hypothetical protein CBOM_06166 [Ceraceosorus bombacis]|uniref:Uncharacterized protein n=1 Tax=Ceraceosorus bombacis TaxID=401625 RepID=A0A0P1BJJ8_9BASI|nr:hypothetical protein CBOM_06166 [Ceraceosorus bombacis]